jgi:hypothetical protein
VHYFGFPKLGSIHSSPLDPKCWCGVFRSISLTFGMYKLHNLCPSLNALFHYRSFEASILLHWTQIDVWECFGAFRWHLTRKEMQYLCSSLSTLLRGTEVAKHSFYSIGTKMMIRSVSEHFANLRHVKRRKTCVSGLNALFRVAKVVKHPLYSIGPKMMFGSVSGHFA